MKVMSFENFKKLFKDSDRERILKDFYYNYQLLVELKEYRRIIKEITNDTYIEPDNKEKRFIDEVIKLGAGEIIEDKPKEDNKIEELSTWFAISDEPTLEGLCKYIDHNNEQFYNKINELVRKVNGE